VNSARAGTANRRASGTDPPIFASCLGGAASAIPVLDFLVAYRPGRPPVPGGVSVDPLGEVFIKLFPEGLRVLFAPAAALPALVDGPPALPVVDDPVDGLTVPTPPVARPELAAEPPAPPVPPACAKAKPVESAIAVASAIILFMMFPLAIWMTVT
jgi:hypothetical protein